MAEESFSVERVQMRRRLLVCLAVSLVIAPQLVWAQQSHSTQAQSKWTKGHRVVIQMDQDDPKAMTLALNNAENMRTYYQSKGEKIEIEFVAFGPGLSMMRSDTSPVKDRIAALSKQGIVFSGCGNTKANQSNAENKTITLLSEAREVPTGVVRITELQEAGWTYLRP
jgi:intracellular sulfur oxidation DsrE/DsrF family protein